MLPATTRGAMIEQDEPFMIELARFAHPGPRDAASVSTFIDPYKSEEAVGGEA